MQVFFSQNVIQITAIWTELKIPVAINQLLLRLYTSSYRMTTGIDTNVASNVSLKITLSIQIIKCKEI